MKEKQYSTSSTDDNSRIDGEISLDLSFDEVKKLRNSSGGIRAFGILLCIFSLSIIVFGAREVEKTIGFSYIFIGLLQLFAAIGILTRVSWGRIAGIICSCLYILSFLGRFFLNLGEFSFLRLILGLCGFIIFVPKDVKLLFGSERITNKELNKEYKLKKKA